MFYIQGLFYFWVLFKKLLYEVGKFDNCPKIQYLLTAESVLMVAMGDLIFFKSQIFTLRSSDPDTTLSPCRANTAVVTGLKQIIYIIH